MDNAEKTLKVAVDDIRVKPSGREVLALIVASGKKEFTKPEFYAAVSSHRLGFLDDAFAALSAKGWIEKRPGKQRRGPHPHVWRRTAKLDKALS